MIYYTNSLKKSCVSGQVFDNGYNKCIKDCSSLPNTKYDDSRGECITKCNPEQIFCSNECYSNNYKCLKDKNGKEVPCKYNISLCGGMDCYDPSKKVCINNTLYEINDPRVCDGIYCDENSKCSQGQYPNTCVTCSKVVCGKTCCDHIQATCAQGGNGNESEFECRYDCPDINKCGTKCCSSEELCSTDKKCIKCDKGQKLCGTNCYDDNLKACDKNNDLCDKNNIIKGSNTCCNGTVYKNSTLCCPTNSVDIKYKVKNDQCLVECGDKDCDLSKNEFCSEINSGKTKKQICQTVNCLWKTIDYTSPDFQDENKTELTFLPSCYMNDSGNMKYYITEQTNLDLTRNVQTKTDAFDTKTNKLYCTGLDCVSRLAEDDLNNFRYDVPDDGKSALCSGIFDCNTLLKKNKKNYCPFTETNRCCKNSDGNYTGQVCDQKDQQCINGFCTTCKECDNGGSCSEKVNGLCECINGFDPKNNCNLCMPGRNLNNKVCELYAAKFTCTQTSGSLYNMAVLTDNKYLSGNTVFSYKEELRKFTKIIFRNNNLNNVSTDFAFIKNVNNIDVNRDRIAGSGANNEFVMKIGDFINMCNGKDYNGIYLFVFWVDQNVNRTPTVEISVFLV